MPRCYMVKKALCNKYINSVARGFESRGRGRNTPSPTNVQPVSPLKIDPYPVALQETQSPEGKDLSPYSSEFSSEFSPSSRFQRVQDLLDKSSDESTLLVVKTASSRNQKDQHVQLNPIDQTTERLVDKTPPSKKCTIISVDKFPPGRITRFHTIKETPIDQSTLTLADKSAIILVEKPPSNRFHRVQDVIENAVDECTVTTVQKCSPTQLKNQDLIENVRYKCSDSTDKFPPRRLKRVQDVIEDVIEQCTPPTIQTKASLTKEAPLPKISTISTISTVTTATTTVITCTGTVTTIPQPAEFKPSTSPPQRLDEALIRLESPRSIKFIDDLRLRQSSPTSSTEGCTSRLEMLSPFRSSPSSLERFSPSSKSVIVSSDEYQNTNDGIQLFRDRSAAETEAAHDLLELSRSLPPLPQPSVAIGPQNVTETPATDVQEMMVYQPKQPVYPVNTILANDLTNSGIYQHHQAEIIYEPTTTNTRTIVQQAPGGVFIPLSPVQEILFTYAAPSVSSSMIAEQSIGSATSSMIVEQSIGSVTSSMIVEQSIGTVPPLTPPISECSSDIENNNPNSQPNQRDKEVQTIAEQSEAKVAAYTYDTLLVADGRSKNKKGPLQQKDTPEAEPVDSLEVPKAGRYVCCECGKQYATSSNLSRHKQTHRSIDSQSAKKCVYCGKAYVSMPALAMHVLTHKLTHSCGICGKMFSRPWLLQGHLRSHTGEKPYGCAHCGKAFADRSNLRAHMQTHSSDKNYECPKCRKSFALKSYLNKHLESACQRENGDDSSNDVDLSSP